MRVTANRLNATDVQNDQVLISFTSLTSFTQAVVFPLAYAAPPIVGTDIVSGAGPTARFGCRAISISATGFTLFIFVTDAAGVATTWVDQPVQWTSSTMQ